MNNATPFLRWAGSKRKLIPTLLKYWSPSYNRYFEPFMGSAQLFFSIDSKKSILSDINFELVLTYKVLKKYPLEINNLLEAMPVNSKFYNHLRSINLSSLTDIERASRFLYLNRFCFNGLYRTNLKGEFNVPFSPTGTGNLPSKERLVEISKKLKGVSIINADFETILRKKVGQNDFVYLDPPYAVENRRIFRQYDPHTFGLDDLERLSKLLIDINGRGVKFLLSYAYCKEALYYFEAWKYKKVFTQRNISGFSSNRRKAVEVLITNINVNW